MAHLTHTGRLATLVFTGLTGLGFAVPGCAETTTGSPSAAQVEPANAVAGYDALLGEHVDAEGMVDYDAIVANPERLDAYVAWLSEVDLATLDDDAKLATLINAYNAFTLRLIADYPGVDSIKDIPEHKRWKHRRWSLGGEIVSLDDVEHEMIRKQFDEPRIHWAVVCAAISCPPLRPEAYVAQRLDAQLAEQSRRVHTSAKWLRFDRATNTLSLTPLYQWYGSDFGEGQAAIVRNVAFYVPGLAPHAEPKIDWLPYDWSLNAQ